jgi:hypothetical protein
METHAGDGAKVSRRTVLTGSAALLAGGSVGSAFCRRKKAMSPLCHTSVSKWSLAIGVKDLHD